MKKIVLWVVVVIGVIILIIAAASAVIQRNLTKLAQTDIPDIDLSDIADGEYEGEYAVFPVSAAVRVTVADHKIVKIELIKHFNGQGSGAEVIPGKVTESQSLDVDIVSGATYSSKVILKAIRNALS